MVTLLAPLGQDKKSAKKPVPDNGYQVEWRSEQQKGEGQLQFPVFAKKAAYSAQQPIPVPMPETGMG